MTIGLRGGRPLGLGRAVAALGVVAAVTIGVVGASRDTSPATWLRHGPGTSNHPVGVVPSAAVTIPEGFPLDDEGRLTCLTCHTQLPGRAGSGDPQLRSAAVWEQYPAAFCAQCHDAHSGADRAAMHASVLAQAHPGAREVTAGRSLVTGTGGMRLDAQSRQCLSCHDGVSAGDALNPASAATRGHAWDPRQNHPVGMAYPRSNPRGSDAQLRPLATLSSTIRLPEGRVSCVSCHDLYQRDAKLLTVPIEGSQLCFSCHDMD